MDWQVIILTLGASLITGAVSLIGNIIISKSNIKKTLLENTTEARKEFMNKRCQAYDRILYCINYLEENKSEKNLLENSELESTWKADYPYCSKQLNQELYMLTKYFDKKNSLNFELKLRNIRNQIKKDLDNYYGVND